MKKAVAMVMTVMMVVVLSVTAFAAGPLTLDQAKQAALSYVGVNAAEATFTKAHPDWENGREVYELEFYANNTEYDVDVDANSGEIMKFSTEFFGGYTTPNYNSAPNGYGNGYFYYDDDMYDRDWDDMYDRDWDDMYDRDWDDMFDYWD